MTLDTRVATIHNPAMTGASSIHVLRHRLAIVDIDINATKEALSQLPDPDVIRTGSAAENTLKALMKHLEELEAESARLKAELQRLQA